MTAPSIKEALKAALRAFKACRPIERVACQDFGMQQDDILEQQLEAALSAALATFQPDGERREAIARLAARFWSIHPKEIQDMGLTREQFYVREMTNLLASGLVQDEAAIRKDEREECAKIADREAEFWQDAESSSARIVAAAIRSARSGGAES